MDNSHFHEKTVIQLTDHVLLQLMIRQTAIACRGTNLLLQGHAGYGRDTLTRLVVHIGQCDFVWIVLASDDMGEDSRRLF
jgi:hypothetical protein